MTDGVVLITTSPIPSHPSTAIIDQTIASVRERTDWPVLVVADGVRPELEAERPGVRDDYEAYLDALHDLAESKGIDYWFHSEWRHQAGAVAGALELDRLGLKAADLLLFVEHDTPLVGEWPWEALCAPLRAGTANVVRAYHEKVLVPAHANMLTGTRARIYIGPEEPWSTGFVEADAVDLHSTRQWSQRPHLARVDYYRRILADYFPSDARTMIEDRMHGILESGDWNDHRVWLWLPEGDYPDGTGLGTQRSDHLDGRADDPKFEVDFGTIR